MCHYTRKQICMKSLTDVNESAETILDVELLLSTQPRTLNDAACALQ